jgi:hypothetical protein
MAFVKVNFTNGSPVIAWKYRSDLFVGQKDRRHFLEAVVEKYCSVVSGQPVN